MAVRNYIVPTDLSLDDLRSIFALTDEIIKDCQKFQDVCKSKVMASLFFEPSTRTKFSFDAAMYRLGGNVIGFADPNTTSQAKGESLADTTRIISGYADLITVRSPYEGAAKHMSMYSSVPIINAGDGGHEHPTQTLTDLMAIRHYKQTLDGHVIGICGDLKFGRTIHSLISALSRYPNNKFVFISPPELQLPDYVAHNIDQSMILRQTDSLINEIGNVDILYMSRVQKERFVSEAEYLRLRDYYILNAEKMKRAKKDMVVMHPLPRLNEISAEVDSDERAIYFEQARYGMYVRMALIMNLLDLG
ncbi:MAG: aspartate carbamoyltransferase [Eubacteriaceae bacterium]|nr:aspartate carbamoyltransferase [Eubacteriaceae bacterium]